MAEPLGQAADGPARRSLGQVIKKRWRAWLRAIHRDVGYLAIGFTVIYAISGIAMNHIGQNDWDPSFHASERVFKITPVADDATDDAAIAQVVAAAAIDSTPKDSYRAGDEVRVTYEDGTSVTAIGDSVTVQQRSDRFFFRVAVWLHATRGKQAWRYISDAYAVLLVYLAISGLFMIKGKLGLKWRGVLLVATGLAGPVLYIVLSGGPSASPDPKVANDTGGSGIRMLSPDENR